MNMNKGIVTKAAPKTGTVRVNGTELYHEIRGSGPPVLFIQGATGDGGTFQRVAELLSDQFTVVTYDSRGNSRSPVPKGWRTTTMAEQAEDAAALIKVLSLTPAAVFGTRGGAIILLRSIKSHPEILRGAVVHEPAMLLNMPGGKEMAHQMGAFMADMLAKGGPRHALETFLPMVMGEAHRYGLVLDSNDFDTQNFEPHENTHWLSPLLGRRNQPVQQW